MQFIQRRELSDIEKDQVIELWNNEYPEKLGYSSREKFDHYLKALNDPSHVILFAKNERIAGWYFDFLREGEKWFAIIISSDFQRKGFGKELLELAKKKESELNGWVIDHNNDRKRNGDMYLSPLNFYLENGFELISDVRLELDKISAVKIKWMRK